MKKIIVIFFCTVMLNGCQYFKGDHCNNTKSIVGKYENKYDKNAKNL